VLGGELNLEKAEKPLCDLTRHDNSKIWSRHAPRLFLPVFAMVGRPSEWTRMNVTCAPITSSSLGKQKIWTDPSHSGGRMADVIN
jgi:hypothetical protein